MLAFVAVAVKAPEKVSCKKQGSNTEPHKQWEHQTTMNVGIQIRISHLTFFLIPFV